jgi:galactokinase/mevalonate kinase-like predicted kinase
MIYRSKAPLRIGLAGGGTDVSPYSDQFGGAILNATVSLFAYANVEPIGKNKIIVEALDRKEKQEFEWSSTVFTKIINYQKQGSGYQRLLMHPRVQGLAHHLHWLSLSLAHLLKC